MTSFQTQLAALPPEKRAALLQRLRQKRAEAENSITPEPRQGRPFPLSYGQARMWFLYQLDPGSALYNVSATICLTGDLDVSRLQTCLDHLVQRHESLRTTFEMFAEQPVQRIAATGWAAMAVTDLMAEPDGEAAFYQRAQMDLTGPFDLETGPVFRAHLYRLSAVESRLLLVMHHIISDGWSLGVLARELAELYRALTENRLPNLPVLPIQCADFAVWQRQWLRGQNWEKLARYWHQQLANAPRLLELPTDKPRPTEQSFKGDRQPFKLADEIYQQAKAVSRQEGVTLFMLLFTAFSVLLSRLADQEDIVIGTPVTNRSHPETMGLVGVFVNTVALRVDLSGNPTGRQLLQRIRQVALDGYAHGAMPFARLVDSLKLSRSLSHSPLFQVSFGLQDNPLQAIEIPDLTVSLLEVRSLLQEGELPPLHTGLAMFDLTFHLSEIVEGVGGWIEYSTDLFAAETITGLAQQYRWILAQIVSQPNKHLSQLTLLDEATWQQVVVAWNQTERPLPTPATLVRLFEQRVAQSAPETAVRQLDQDGQLVAALTFAELNQRANKLAHYLRTQGIGPEMLVGICAERSAAMLVGILGILKAGGGYVPLPPDYPEERLAFMIEDADLALIVSQTALLPRLAAVDLPIVCLDRDADAIARQPAHTLPVVVQPDNTAYVIYTSGSTGRPKGVVVTQRNITNLVLAQIEAFALTSESRVLQFAILGFDAAVSEIFTTLVSGATLVLAPGERLMPGADFVELLNQEAVTTITLPPSALRVMESHQLPHLKTIVSAGEACPAELAAKWAPGRRFLNFYGPTEATVGCCYELVEAVADLAAATETVPIGRPIQNVQLYVLDRYGQPLPPGVPGELAVGGMGVARGYLGRPLLTAEKFVADPFSPSPAARLYRTGDLVVYEADGRLRFLRRQDHQIKLRGFRIEPGEIEAVLTSHPAVAAAIALVTQSETGHSHLTACFIPTSESVPDLAALRQFLAQQLPDYMIPAYFKPVTAWPLTPNGKVDRQALVEIKTEQLQSGTNFTASRNEVEATLTAIWQALLPVEKIGIHDNFFELGGDSILSIQMVARARTHHIQLNPRQIFQNQTIAQLAAVAGQAVTVEAEQGEVSGDVPLTAIQQWFFAQELLEPHHWNQAVMLRVDKPLQVADLQTAIKAVIGQHDALRLRFVQVDGQWQQFHGALSATAVFTHVDLRPIPLTDRPDVVNRTVEAAQTSLHLSDGPLWQVVYFDNGPGTAGRLFCLAHHLIVDGVSWRILLEDLQTAYRQICEGQPVSLPPKTTSFKQWAAAVTAYGQSESILAALPYWVQQIEGSRPLPVDNTAGLAANTMAQVHSLGTCLDGALTQALLQDVPPVYQTQVNDVLLAALLLAYRDWSGQNKLLVDMEGHGRETWTDTQDVSRTVGWFTTLYPVQLRLDATEPGDVLKSVKEQLRAVPHNGLSYGLLQYLHRGTAVTAALAGRPSAAISFNYLGQMIGTESGWFLTDEPTGPVCSPKAKRPHLIEIESQVVQGQLRVVWYYNEQIHRPETIQRVAQSYLDYLHELITHCQHPEAGGYTPSDFPVARLDQQKLDNVLAELFSD